VILTPLTPGTFSAAMSRARGGLIRYNLTVPVSLGEVHPLGMGRSGGSIAPGSGWMVPVQNVQNHPKFGPQRILDILGILDSFI
jgi:hypothetical protein